MRPFRRGSWESRQRFSPPSLDAALRLWVWLPQPIRHRFRRAATRLVRTPTVLCRTAWGTIEVGANETQFLTPYTGEPVESALMARLVGPGDTVLDLGANRGWRALLLAQRVGSRGKVVAIEPDPWLTARFERLLCINGVVERVRLLRLAMAMEPGERSMAFESELAQRFLSDEPVSETGSHLPAPVRTLSYRALLTLCSSDRIDLLKLDAEGFKTEELRGLLDAVSSGARPPTILFEFEPQLWKGGVGGAASMGKITSTYHLYGLSISGAITKVDRLDSAQLRLRTVVAVPIGPEGDRTRTALGL